MMPMVVGRVQPSRRLVSSAGQQQEADTWWRDGQHAGALRPNNKNKTTLYLSAASRTNDASALHLMYLA